MNRRVLVLLLMTALSAMADIIHVPGDYPTIQQGIDAAVSGDIVFVAAGRYVEEIQLKAGVVVRGAGEGRSIIDGGGDAGDVVRAIGNSIHNDAKLQGFTVTGAANGGGMPGGASLFCNSGAAPEISNCRMESSDVGIALWNGSSACIHNNVICHNTYDGFTTGSGATFVNNTVHSNRIGVYDYSGYGPTVMNNIITANRLYGVSGPSSGQGPVLTYNDVWNNATDYHQATPGVGSDSVDPLYVDTVAGDYHLGPGSPCIDHGNPAPEYDDPDGTRNDMGAYGGPGAVSDLPAVTSLDPAQNALGVPADATIAAGFNLDMNGSTLNPQTVRLSGAWSGWRWGTIEYDSVGKVVTLEPDGDFLPGELATALLAKSITTQGGDSLPGFSWQFTAAVPGGSGQFANPETLPTHLAPYNIIAADFSRDANVDLAVVDLGTQEIAILLGQGNGSFDTFAFYPLGSMPRAACAGDFDSDSILDIAVAVSGANRLEVLLGNGDGTFTSPVPYAADPNPTGLCAADLNLDGFLDLASTCPGGDRVALLLGNGNGTFAAAAYCTTGFAPVAVAAADFDNDGWPDLITADYDSGRVSVLLGHGDGTFLPATSFPAGQRPVAVVAGDLNADGNVDVAVTNTDADSISVLIGDGDGGLGARNMYAAFGATVGLALADLNGDGALDLVSASDGAGQALVFLNNGSGAFAPGVGFGTGGNGTISVAAADFDSDGDLDLATANYLTDNVSVLLNDDALAVTALVPDQYEVGAPDTTYLAASFNQALDLSTLDSSSFRVDGSLTGPHTGAIAYDSVTRTATLDPTLRFAPGEQVTALLTNRIQSGSGVDLGGFGWTFAAAIGAGSAGTFGTPSNSSAGSQVRGVWAADFDSDGDFDLAVTSNNPAAVAMLKNNGDGTFAAPQYASVDSEPISLFGADFDSDRDIDLAVFHNQPGSSHLEILKNDGAGRFSVAADYAPAVLGQHVTGADLDSDGDVDLVLADGWGSQDNVRIMTNDGTGSFTGPYNYSAGSWARAAAAIDAENDGDFDLAVANAGNNNVSLLYNDGSGSFPIQADFSAGSNPTRVHANDLNGDGIADLAVANYGENNVSILLNNGSGGFAPAVGYAVGGTARALAGADFNGDNDVDLVLSVPNSNSLAVLANNGDGTFASPAAYTVGTLPWDCVTADFNLDGALDLACANYNSNSVSVLFGTGLGISASSTTIPRASLTAVPNPFRNTLRINCSLLPTNSTLRVYDVQGCLVRALPVPRSRAPRALSLTWDARDDTGRKVAPGLYFVALESGAVRTRAKVVLSR